ncbi:hypothetical protein HYH02_002673 [Chlamydomonas schloesseri]|uniref:Uncharacterized protein n=1 Tax=Chlamydomonas schloesseri TaxID=2026947 RepID=A0A835WTU4_9CHLO|nr:hypothetical protein HYH02_002673 [Chlamydomonas schloesseri]|eukprot:KAG2452430.1 hypothetical protein HYH02_002673 [Chlamydomonas schloesseri]
MSKIALCQAGQEHRRVGRSRSVEDVWRHDDVDNTVDGSSCICQNHRGEELLSSAGACRSSYCAASSARCHDSSHCDSDSDAESVEGWVEERQLSYYEWVSLPRPVVRPPGLPRAPRRIESAPCFNQWGASAAAQFQPLAACGLTGSWADEDEDDEELDLGALADWMKEGLAEQAATCTAAAGTGADSCCPPASSVERAGPEQQPVEAEPPAQPSGAAPDAAAAALPRNAAADAEEQPPQLPLQAAAAADLVTGFSCPGVARLVLSQSPAGGKAGAARRAASDGSEQDGDDDDACSEPNSPGSSDCGCGLDGSSSGSSHLGLGSDGSGSRCCSSLSLSSWDTGAGSLTRHGSLTEEEAVAECEACGGVLCGGACGYASHSFGASSSCSPVPACLEEGAPLRPCSPAPGGLVASSCCIAYSAVVAAAAAGAASTAVLGVAPSAACGEAAMVAAAAVYSCTYIYGCGTCGGGSVPVPPAADLQACALSSCSATTAGSAAAGMGCCSSSSASSTLVSPTPVVCWETSAWEQRIAALQQQHLHHQEQHLMAAAAAPCAADVVECPAWLEPALCAMLSQVVAEALWGEDV